MRWTRLLLVRVLVLSLATAGCPDDGEGTDYVREGSPPLPEPDAASWSPSTLASGPVGPTPTGVVG